MIAARTLLVLALASAAAAPQAGPGRVYVFATDASGTPVRDLAETDLDVKVDGAPARLLRLAHGSDPIRVVIISDVSDDAEIGPVKQGLRQMLAALPQGAEVSIGTAAGGYASRLQPTADRDRASRAVNALPNAGGELARALMDADRTLFTGQPARWPVYVIVANDSAENTSGVKQFEFDRFSDRLSATATVHAVLSREGDNSQTGKIIDALARNLTANTGGLYREVARGRGLADAVAAVGDRIAADAARMADGYELVYDGAPAGADINLEIGVSRPGVTLRPSLRRVP